MKKEEDFVMGLSIYMACLREKKRYSTAKSYQDALNSFKCFCGMEAIPILIGTGFCAISHGCWTRAVR
jgi:hypothetical protein